MILIFKFKWTPHPQLAIWLQMLWPKGRSFTSTGCACFCQVNVCYSQRNESFWMPLIFSRISEYLKTSLFLIFFQFIFIAARVSSQDCFEHPDTVLGIFCYTFVLKVLHALMELYTISYEWTPIVTKVFSV